MEQGDKGGHLYIYVSGIINITESTGNVRVLTTATY